MQFRLSRVEGIYTCSFIEHMHDWMIFVSNHKKHNGHYSYSIETMRYDCAFVILYKILD